MSDEDVEAAARRDGLREGLQGPGGPLVWADLPADAGTGPEAMRRAGIVSGRLWAAATARTPPADDGFVLLAIGYGSALSTPPAQRALARGDVDGVVKAHVYACALGERHGHSYGDEDERWLFEWLCEQMQVVVTADLDARVLRLRARRLARGPGRARPEP